MMDFFSSFPAVYGISRECISANHMILVEQYLFFLVCFSNFTSLRRRELHMCVIGKTDGFFPLAGREKQALLDIYTM